MMKGKNFGELKLPIQGGWAFKSIINFLQNLEDNEPTEKLKE